MYPLAGVAVHPRKVDAGGAGRSRQGCRGVRDGMEMRCGARTILQSPHSISSKYKYLLIAMIYPLTFRAYQCLIIPPNHRSLKAS